MGRNNVHVQAHCRKGAKVPDEISGAAVLTSPYGSASAAGRPIDKPWAARALGIKKETLNPFEGRFSRILFCAPPKSIATHGYCTAMIALTSCMRSGSVSRGRASTTDANRVSNDVTSPSVRPLT